MYKFFSYFLLIQLLLFSLEQFSYVHTHVIVPFTEGIAYLSAWLVQLFDDQVISHGVILQQAETGFAVSIQSGCNGVEALLILTAAILAFSAPWKFKLYGIVGGFFAVEALNIVRIISLFYLGQWDEEIFEWAHLYIWQALIMLDVLIVFLFWVRRLPVTEEDDGDAYAN